MCGLTVQPSTPHVGAVRLAELRDLCDSCRSFASLEASTPEEALAALTEGMKRRAALAEVFFRTWIQLL